MKKRIFIGIGVVIGIALIGLVLYLFWKTFAVFGFWRLFLTGILDAIIASVFIQALGSGRSEKGAVVTYNPKEWPKLLGVFLLLGVGYYLYDYLNKVPDISDFDYKYGLSYLILLTLLPMLKTIYVLIRDRNDFISLSADTLSYRDNATREQFKIADLVSAGIAEKGIKLTFLDGTDHRIPVERMNFNGRDLIGVLAEIQKRIPEENKPKEEPEAEAPADTGNETEDTAAPENTPD